MATTDPWLHGLLGLSTPIALWWGIQPVSAAVFGVPLGFAVILIAAWFRRDLLQGYRYPKWLLIAGTAIWLLTIYMGANSLSGLAALWSQG